MAIMIKIKASKREKAGKGASRAIRRTGLVPTVIYGDKKAPVLCSVEEKALVALLNKKGIWTHQFEVDVDGEKYRSICQDIQFHPLSDRPIHADFLRISKNTHLVMEIPLHFINETTSVGIKKGGVLNIVHRALEVSCFPDNIPEHLELDIEALDIGDGLTTKNIKLPEGVKLTNDEELTVVTIAEPAKEEVEPTPVATPAEGATEEKGNATPAENAKANPAPSEQPEKEGKK